MNRKPHTRAPSAKTILDAGHCEEPSVVYEKVLRGEATPADYNEAVRRKVAERNLPEELRRDAVIAKIETSKPPERAARHGLRDIWRAISNAIVPPISRKRS